jgi:hypothetical protein
MLGQVHQDVSTKSILTSRLNIYIILRISVINRSSYFLSHIGVNVEGTSSIDYHFLLNSYPI